MVRGWLLLVAGLAAGCTTLPPNADAELEQQFTRFLEWFPGRYDSALQMQQQAASTLPDEERNYRRHSIFRRVDLPAFGETVFLAHQYRDGDPTKVYRQRIYVLDPVPSENAIRLTVHIPKEDGRLDGAYGNPALLDGLTPQQMTVWPGCDLLWRWEEERFVGRLRPGACRFQSDTFGTVVLDEYIVLLPNAIWFADRGLSTEGAYLFGMRGAEENKSLRARPFVCSTDTGEAVWTHDQGGRFEIGETLFALERWGEDLSPRSALTVRVVGAKGSGPAARGEGGADEISFDHAGQTITCRHTPDRLYNDGR